MKQILIIFSLILSFSSFAKDYKIDPDHSSVGFSVKHLVISKTKGKFNEFEGTFSYDPKNSKTWKTEVAINVESIDTENKKRDDHLRSEDFFDAGKFPKITFMSKKVTHVSGKKAKVQGDLTIRGVTKPVTLDVTRNGEMTDPWGNERAGFSAVTKINRKDFGMTWNKALETGGVLVGDDIEIMIEVEGIAKK